MSKFLRWAAAFLHFFATLTLDFNFYWKYRLYNRPLLSYACAFRVDMCTISCFTFPFVYTLCNYKIYVSSFCHWSYQTRSRNFRSLTLNSAKTHANLWVSFSTGTSRLNRHTHDLTVEDRKQELAIFSMTIILQCSGASFAFAWRKIKEKRKSKNRSK